MQTQAEALASLIQSWPAIIKECRCVLASELHYQVVVYHCLREVGQVPLKQIGMNVKTWIPDVVSDYFRALDLRKPEDFRGGFGPIPDIVIFRPDIQGDFRRRNNSNTLRQMLMAIEIKHPKGTRADLEQEKSLTTYSNSMLIGLRPGTEDRVSFPLCS